MNGSLTVPYGYARSSMSLSNLRTWLLVHHHPEYVRRLVEWLSAQNGLIGVGGGWRATGTQPAKPGFAPEGKSFHQNQEFRDGWINAAAVDLVARNGAGVHRAPTWPEVPRQGSALAKVWGLHCNIDTEPWHMQPIEIDGWQSWVDAGRPAPKAGYRLPTDPAPRPTTVQVVPGDSYWAISRRFGLTVDQLVLANPMPLHPGMVLKVPAA